MRRRCLLALAVLGVLIVSTSSAWTPGEDTGGLSGRLLVGERIVAGFDGPSIPDGLRRQIRRGEVAGVILFADNYSSADAARRLSGRLQSIPRPGPLAGRPLLIMLDQEGGLVKRLPGPPCCSAETMGGWDSPRIRREGRATGRTLLEARVNVNLAPVLDVARPGSAIGAQDRAFGDSAKRVKRAANAFATGLERTGVAATAKHFPGLGAAGEDTDFAVQRIHISRHTLRTVDERPYGRFKKLGGSMVMLSTAIYPRLDPNLPAALSRDVATIELRRRAGFSGVSISDALDTTSARAIGGPRRLARLAVRAGTDLLLFTSVGDATAANHALRRGLRSGAIERSNFERSAGRVLSLRDELPR